MAGVGDAMAGVSCAPGRQRLEKGVAKDSVWSCGAVQISDARIKALSINQSGGQGCFPYAFDHGCEGVAGEPLDHVRFAAIHIDHPG